MTDSHALLSEYVRTGSEAAFQQLVGRYLDLVYSTALRLVGGDRQLAEDVSQTVFLNLARKARRLPPDLMLGGWLHRDACFAARTLMRGERRRQKRERQAIEMSAIEDHSAANLARLAPLLDEAIEELRANDRAAILLRFFEQRDFRSIGQALGSNEEAARKRVERAIEKLHDLLKVRGVSLSAAALGTVLATNTITAAPGGLAASVAGAALAGAGTAAWLPATLLKIAAMTKIHASLLGTVVLLGAAASLVIQYRTQAALRGLDEESARQSAELARQQSENERLTRLTPDAAGAGGNNLAALTSLRREVESLRRQTNTPAASASRRATTQFPILERKEQDKQWGIARLNYTKRWLQAFHDFARKNGNQLPTSFDQALPFLPQTTIFETNLAPGQFEIVYRGADTNVADPGLVVVLREKQPSRAYNGGWTRAHGFLDGHSEVNFSADGDYTAWEKRKVIGQPVEP